MRVNAVWRVGGLFLVSLQLASCGDGLDLGGGGDVIPAFDLRHGVAASDLDGDGRVDVAITNTYISKAPPHAGTARVYLHDSGDPRAFAAPLVYEVGADPWDVIAADVTGDGRNDLVVSTPGSDALWLLEQSASTTGRFIPARAIATLRAPYGMVAIDLDADGRTDLGASVDDATVRGLSLLLQSHTLPGQFGIATSVPLGAGAVSIAAADIDGDGRNDLIAATPSEDQALRGVYCALQDRIVPGTFGVAMRLDAGQKPEQLAVADLNGDRHPDIVVSNAGVNGRGSGFTVLLANAPQPGQFQAGVTYVLQNRVATMVRIADMNRDGLPDIVVSAAITGLVNEARSVVQVFMQVPLDRGRFAFDGEYPSGSLADFVATADLDGDGLQDVVTAEGPGVLYNDSTRPGKLLALRAL